MSKLPLARSRLKKSPAPAPTSPAPTPTTSAQTTKTESRARVSLQAPSSSDKVRLYLTKLPTLVIGLVFLGALWWLVNTLPPHQIADIGFQGSYLPALGLWFLGTFFVCSYFFLHTRRGFWLAFLTSWIWYWRLNQIDPGWWWLTSLLFFVILEYLLTKLDNHVNQNQSPNTR